MRIEWDRALTAHKPFTKERRKDLDFYSWIQSYDVTDVMKLVEQSAQ